MRRAARVDHGAGIRQLLEQGAGAAGVVQMDVGEDQPVHVGRREACGFQPAQQRRHRVRGAAVDEGGAAVLDDQVGRIEQRAVETGVDDMDAVGQGLEEGQGHGRRRGQERHTFPSPPPCQRAFHMRAM